MNNSKLFKFEKHHLETQFILFVSKALKKPERSGYREHLSKIYCDSKRVIATDGHRLHVYTPDECMMEKGFYSVEKKTKTAIHLSFDKSCQGTIGEYPNIDKVIPEKKGITTFSHTGANAMIAEVLRSMGDGCVNIDFFKDAISISDIREFQAPSGLVPVALYGGTVMALIMPCRS